MSSVSSEQEHDRCHSSPLVPSSSAIIKDIHQEIGVLFPTPPTMTIHENSIENLPGPTPGRLVNDSFSAVSMPTPPAPAGNHHSHENAPITDFDTETSSEWSTTTSPLPSPEVLSPTNAPSTMYISGETVVCIPLDIRDRPFVIPPTIPRHQYTQCLPPCQLCCFPTATDAEMFVWTEIQQRASYVHNDNSHTNVTANRMPNPTPTQETQAPSTHAMHNSLPTPPVTTTAAPFAPNMPTMIHGASTLPFFPSLPVNKYDNTGVCED